MENPNSPPPGSPAPGRPDPFTITRRRFVRHCAMVAAATGLPLWFVERQQADAAENPAVPTPNDRPGIALVGCGGRGVGVAKDAAKFGEIIAVCDVDATHAEKAAKTFTVGTKVPKIHSDFRRVMEDPDVHVVVNATPDHWHTLVNIAAARAAKDVYAEKPLTLTIDEGRRLVRIVRGCNIVLQTGTQQRSDARFRLACELVRNGRIGRLQRANVWLPAGLRDGPFPVVPVPAGLNWDFWQGQTPAVAFLKERCFSTFRFWYEYSGGTMTDWGAHHNDIAFWAIGLLAPTHVEGTPLSQPIPGGYTTFADYRVKYTYSNGVELNIATTRDDSIYGEHKNKAGQPNGIRFEGTDGWIWVNRDGISASHHGLLKAAIPEDGVHLYNSKNHMGNFFSCVRSRQLPVADVETGHRSATMCHLGAIALRTGLKLQWNAGDEEFVGDGSAVANTYIAREMRAPFDYSMVA
jgi:predicted dehydrogenase